MNVENRKLFRNKDARSRLASMGGIMGSSPELLGTVQKFQDAGPVAPSTFLVQLPGLVGGNEFLQLTAAELQLLNEKQPGLMTSEGVMIQEATPEILSNLNPAQVNTTDNPNIKRMFADLGVELSQEQGPIEAGGSSFLDTIKSYLTPSGESSGSSALDELRAAQSGIATTEGVLTPSSALDDLRAARANIATTEGVLGPSSALDDLRAARANIATTEMFGTGDQQDPQQQVGEPVRDSSGNLLPVAGPLMPENTGISSLPVSPPAPVRDSSGNLLPVAGPLMPETTSISSLPVIAPDPVIEADRLRTTAILQGKMPPAMESEQMLLNAPSLSEMSSSELEAEKISRAKPISTFFSDAFNSIKNSSSGFDAAVVGALGTAASAMGNEKAGAFLFDLEKEFETLKTKTDPKSRQRKLEIESSVKEVTDELDRRNMDPGVGGPEVTSEDIDKAVKEAERDKVVAGAVDPGVGGPEVDKKAMDAAMNLSKVGNVTVSEGTSLADSADKTTKSFIDAALGGKTGSAKDNVKSYEAQFREMLGIKDEDKAKEMWHNLSMIGFAIAAGQDPSALANIAQGMLQGTKMMKADRDEERKTDREIGMMAINAAREDKRAEDALQATLAAEIRQDKRLINKEERQKATAADLYQTKLILAKQFETPDSVLKTDPQMKIIYEAFKGLDTSVFGSADTPLSVLETTYGFTPKNVKRFAQIAGIPYGKGNETQEDTFDQI